MIMRKTPPPAPPTPPGPQVQAGTLTAATTGLVLWGLDGVFHGAIPTEVYAWVVLAVPYLLGRLGAEIAYRRARNRLDAI